MPADRLPLKGEVKTEWLTDAAYERGVRDGRRKERERLRELVAVIETNYVGQEGRGAARLTRDSILRMLEPNDG